MRGSSSCFYLIDLVYWFDMQSPSITLLNTFQTSFPAPITRTILFTTCGLHAELRHILNLTG